jgi:hypothetical protein
VVIQNLVCSTGAGYTHAKLAETEHGFFAGQRLPEVPEVTATAGLGYRVPLSAKYEFNSRFDDSYTGSRVGIGSAYGLINQTNPIARV